MSIKLNAQSGGSVALDAPTQTDSSADLTLTLPVNTGTSGQVIQTNGSGALSFASPAASWVHAAPVTLPTNTHTITLTGVPDGASHIRYLIRYLSFAGVAQTKFRVQKSTTGGSKSIITANYQSYAAYFGGNGRSGGGATDRMELFYGYTNVHKFL